jgi:rod shape-determining protein MreD
MTKLKMKRLGWTIGYIVVCYLLQCTLFNAFTLASIKPNLLLVVTASIGFMRGAKEGMLVGFFSGLLIDIQFGNVLGFYAFVYFVIGYMNSMFQQLYYDEAIKLPIVLIAFSEFLYGLIIYVFLFLLRSEFHFVYYFTHNIVPELIYTVVIALGLYPMMMFTNFRLETEEKRSASKFG